MLSGAKGNSSSSAFDRPRRSLHSGRFLREERTNLRPAPAEVGRNGALHRRNSRQGWFMLWTKSLPAILQPARGSDLVGDDRGGCASVTETGGDLPRGVPPCPPIALPPRLRRTAWQPTRSRVGRPLQRRFYCPQVMARPRWRQALRLLRALLLIHRPHPSAAPPPSPRCPVTQTGSWREAELPAPAGTWPFPTSSPQVFPKMLEP